MAIKYKGRTINEQEAVSVRLEPVLGYDYSSYNTESGEGLIETTTYWLTPESFQYSSSIEEDKETGTYYSASYFLVRPISFTGSFYGVLYGTASYAITASYVDAIVPTASYALSASYLIGGGAGTPGGSDTQIQYNNASSFGGVPVLTYDGSTLRATGSFTGSFEGVINGGTF